MPTGEHHHHQQAAFVVAVREIDRFFTLVGDGNARQRQIDVFGLQCRNDPTEIHRLQFVIQLQLFSDGSPQINVKAHIFIALFKFKRNEGGIRRDN